MGLAFFTLIPDDFIFIMTNSSQETGVQAKEATDQLIREYFDRRRVLRWMGWGCVWLFIATFVGSTIRYFFPRVLFEPPIKFKVGFPSAYTIGVSERFTQYGIWIVREIDRFYIIEAKCTHLGCTPFWLKSEKKFKCPCHGGGFTPEGINIEGPPPRPLERFKVTLAEDGQILVDKSVRFRGERGQWDRPGAFLSA